MEYDFSNRVSSVKFEGDSLLKQDFDKARLKTQTYGNGLRVTHDYNDTDACAGLCDGIGHESYIPASFSWVGMGFEVDGRDLGGTKRAGGSGAGNWVFDPEGGSASTLLMLNHLGSGEVELKESFGYKMSQPLGNDYSNTDRESRRLQMVMTDGGNRLYYQDGLGNTVMTLREGEPEIDIHSTTDRFQYDSTGSRLLEVGIAEGYGEDGSDYHQTLSFGYDSSGFVTRRGDLQFVWNANGQIAEITDDGASETAGDWSFDYDGSGQLTARTHNNTPQRTWSHNGRVAWKGGLAPVLDLGWVEIDLLEQGDTIYRQSDFRGNVHFLTNEDGQIFARYKYDAYGIGDYVPDAANQHDRLLMIQGPMEGQFNKHRDSEHRFAGGFHIPNTDFTILGPRILDGETHRFLSPDPVHHLRSQYTYANGNPIDLWDPSGNIPVLIPVAAKAVFWTVSIAAGGLSSALSLIELGVGR